MIAALLLGRKGSVGFPGKNTYPVAGKPLMAYPLIAALNSRFVDEVYVSTDSERIKEIGRRYGAVIINRPKYLCTKKALGEDAYVHGYRYIKDKLKKDVELIVLLFCNAPTVTSRIIDVGVSIVRPRCLENIDNGILPQRWMGRKIYPLKQWGGMDVDYEWQMPQTEFWLKKHRGAKNAEGGSK